jgi:hypothetical protein
MEQNRNPRDKPALENSVDDGYTDERTPVVELLKRYGFFEVI